MTRKITKPGRLDMQRSREDKLAAVPAPSEPRMIQRFRVPIPLFVTLLLLAGCHGSHRPPAASATPHAPYVRADDIDYKSLLPGPPADGSPAHGAEIEQMLKLQASRTPAEEARCQSEEEVT